MPKPRSPAEIARVGYAAWNTGDLEAFLGNVHPDIVWISSGIFPGLRPRYSGHTGMREFWADFVGPWETLELEEERLLELDDQTALGVVRFHARGRDGIEVERTITIHMVIRDEKLYRCNGYADWEQALAELGIEDPSAEAPAPQGRHDGT